MITEADRRFMALAIGLGARGLGQVWPNPAVGAVVVQADRIVGRGWTQPGGRPHAETIALEQAGALARGATAYVSLEPCAHHGKTPPCAEALIAAGVARVVTSIEDPDSRVSGRGHAMLRASGINVETGLMAAEAEQVQRGFLNRIRTGRPMVTLKLATSLDGRIATATGESQWITGPEARRMVHALRKSHDAVMIGAGTARADDPMLNVRDFGQVRQPVRIVAARTLEIPLDGNLGRTAKDIPLWLLHGPLASPERRAAWASCGARLIACPEHEGGLDVASAMAQLGAEGLTRIFCEGGGQLAAALLRADLVDELTIFAAGTMLGSDGRAAVGPLLLEHLAKARRFRCRESRQVGGDIFSLWDRD